LAKNGFIVVASNYRYIGKKGKYDQIAGNDVDDVINLYKQIIKLDYVDSNNVFMMGISRGGLMTYKSLSKITVNAAAVIGGVANFEDGIKKRPIFLKGWDDLSDEENYLGLENVLSNFQEKKEFYFKERNALAWADQIKTPIYLLHSRQDGRVRVTQALNMANKLQELNKKYKLKIYDKKSHSLPYSKFDSFDEIIKWFKQHLKTGKF
jgi:dipeptidyl aminopeptidase/acylaminoacyl peptidase